MRNNNFIISLLLIISLITCDDVTLFRAIQYDRMPDQSIENIQILSVNSLVLDMEYELNGQEVDNLSNFVILDSENNQVEVKSATLDENDNSKIILITNFFNDNTSYNITIYNLVSLYTKTLPESGLSFPFTTPDFEDSESPALLKYCVKSDIDYCYEYDTEWANPTTELVYPVNGIEFFFDEPMESVSAKAAFSFIVNNEKQDIPDGTWTDLSDSVLYSFEDIRIRSKCQIILTDDAKDSRGNALSNPITDELDIYFYSGDPEGADDFEPDDNFTDATWIELDTVYMGKIHQENDEDFYKIALDKESLYFINLGNIPENADYDISVYYAANTDSEVENLIIYPANYKKYLFIPPIDDEHVYYLKVYSNDGFSTSQFYTLIVEQYITEQEIYFDTTLINASNSSAIYITIVGANETDSYKFDIVSSGSTQGTVGTKSFTDTVGDGNLIIDSSDLYDGTLNIWEFIITDTNNISSDPIKGINDALKDTIVPSGYNISFITDPVYTANVSEVQFSLNGGDSTDRYSFDITSTGGGTETYTGTYGTGTISVDLSASNDGDLSISNFTLTDICGNEGSTEIGLNEAYKDATRPTNVSWTASDTINPGANITTTYSEIADQSAAENIANYTINYISGSSGVSITDVSYSQATGIATFTVSYAGTGGLEVFTIEPGTSINDLSGNALSATISPQYTAIAIWDAMYGGDSYDNAGSIMQTNDGGYIVIGYSHSANIIPDQGSNTADEDYYIIKLNSDGSKAWDAMYGGDQADYGNSIVQTNDSGYIVAGRSQSTDIIPDQGSNTADEDYYIIKLNNDGYMAWDAMYGGDQADYGYSIVQTNNGGYIVAGISNSTDISPTQGASNQGSFDIYIIKLNSDGSKEWDAMYGGNSGDYPYSISQTSDGGYIVAGFSNSTDITPDLGSNTTDYDYYIIKLNNDGSMVLDAMYGGNDTESPYSITQASDGGYIMAGYSDSTDITPDQGSNTADADYYIMKISPDGIFHD